MGTNMPHNLIGYLNDPQGFIYTCNLKNAIVLPTPKLPFKFFCSQAHTRIKTVEERGIHPLGLLMFHDMFIMFFYGGLGSSN